MDIVGGCKWCGRKFSPEELDLIRETVHDCSALSFSELAETVCELLDWRRPNGRLKGRECRELLDTLESEGILRLPSRAGRLPRAAVPPLALPVVTEPVAEPLCLSLSEVAPLYLERVENREDQRMWRQLVDGHHYLGSRTAFGASLRYFVCIMRPEPRRVGCIQVSSPAWRVAARDQWIEWDDRQRERNLQRIVQNSRFLLLAWVRIPNLASAALSRLVRQLPDDWEERFGIRPFLMETFVDTARFAGTCYRAANWIPLGLTTGRGRMDREHQRDGASPKQVLVYPLCRKARERLREG